MFAVFDSRQADSSKVDANDKTDAYSQKIAPPNKECEHVYAYSYTIVQYISENSEQFENVFVRCISFW
jgi:hypothetical protein